MESYVVTVSSNISEADCKISCAEIRLHFQHEWNWNLTTTNMFVTANEIQKWFYNVLIDTTDEEIVDNGDFTISDRKYYFNIQMQHGMYSMKGK